MNTPTRGIGWRLTGAVAAAFAVIIWAGCAGQTPPPPTPASSPAAPSPSATTEEPASAESSDEPEEAASEEAPAPAHTAAPPPKPVVHHHRHKKKPKPKPAPAVSAPKAPPPPPPKPKGPSVHPIGPEETMSVLGRKVVDADGNELGRVVNIVVDNRSHVRALVVDFGGFLGVGNRQIAVNWDLLEFRPNAGDKALVLKVSRDEVEGAPEYQDSMHPSALEGPAVASPPATAHSGR